MRKNGPVKATEEFRPPLLGFDPASAGLLQVANQLVSMRMEQGNPKLKHLPGPLFPHEIVDERLRRFTAGKRTDVIEQSRARNAARRGLKIDA